jgi:hypothetical protein
LCVEIDISENKKVPLSALSTAIKRMGIERRVAEAAVQAIDDSLVEGFCGPKHARGNGGRRYQRAGTARRRPGTCLGRLDLRIGKVRDTSGQGTEASTFRPLDAVISFDGRRVYQEDISMIGVELATKMTYWDAAREGRLFVDDMPSRSTLNRRTIEYGARIKALNTDDIRCASVGTAFVDGTKTHTQERDRSKNTVNVSLAHS